ATVMNSLALQDALVKAGVASRVMSALRMDQVCEYYVRRNAVEYLQHGEVVMLAAGTGNPYFTTDTAASLRAIEIGAQLMIKATKVNGVYSSDPVVNPDAVYYPRLSYDRVLAEGLQVMDTTAVVLCRDNALPLRVMNINETGALLRLMRGEPVGSLVDRGE
ncbi:MAG: uridine monophosphate kinase, partial [Gammaproteobacteria bacterium]|nr:uridine monophosphate kinase [Gammaproteobacteria bacterium]